MANKIFVIAEAASEIGKALALNLAKTGATVVLVAPDAEHGNAALEKIAMATQNPNLHLELCDLSILSSVRNLSEILKSKLEKINMLINTTGVYKRKPTLTTDGLERTFAANYLGPFLLTNLLLEPLQAAVQADGSARVWNLTPPARTPLNFEQLQNQKNFHSADAFEAASMATLLFTLALAQKLENTGITVNAIAPGSGPLEESPNVLSRLTSRSPRKTVEGILQALTRPSLEKTTGKFLQAGEEVEPPAYAQDQDVQQKLWKVSEELSQLSSTKGITPINDPHLS